MILGSLYFFFGSWFFAFSTWISVLFPTDVTYSVVARFMQLLHEPNQEPCLKITSN